MTNETQLQALSDRLAEHQATIEVMAEALDLKDAEFLDCMEQLQTAGGFEFSNVDALADGIRGLRGEANTLAGIRDLLAGKLDPDKQLLMFLAISLGADSEELDDVTSRAQELSNAQMRAAELFRQNLELRQAAEDA